MPFDCSITVTGVLPEVSAKAFIDSYNETSDMDYYKKDLNHIQQYFQDKLEKNIAQAKIQNPRLKNSFSVRIQGQNMIFSSDDPVAAVYEYGAGSRPPQRYLQPSVMDTANEMASIILNDAVEIYNKKTRFGSGIHKTMFTPDLIKSTKYSNTLQ